VIGQGLVVFATVRTVISCSVVLSVLLFTFSTTSACEWTRGVVSRVPQSTVNGDGSHRSRRGVLDLKPERKEFQRCGIRNNRKEETREPDHRAS
jgi:hypothetical protein